MLPENNAYFVQGDDQSEYGPVQLDELREWVRENRAGVGTAVKTDEPGAIWHPWQYYPELVALQAEANVVGPTSALPGMVVAPIGRRMLAFILDMFISTGIITASLIVVMFAVVPTDLMLQVGEAANRLPQPQIQVPTSVAMEVNGLYLGFVVFYMVTFQGLYGMSPAKRLLKLRVVDDQGRKPPFMKIVVRAVVLAISITLYGIPLAYAFFNPQRRAFHDFIAGTYVVEA